MNKENDPSALNKGGDAHSKIQNFFDTTWNTLISKGRYAIIVVVLIWFGITCYFAPKMGPQTEQPKFISDDNPIWRPIAVSNNEFAAQAEWFKDAIVFWGAGEIDREGESSWDAEFIGKISFDETFDMAAPKTAEHISS